MASSAAEDGLLEMKLALPRQLGGKGDATSLSYSAVQL